MPCLKVPLLQSGGAICHHLILSPPVLSAFFTWALSGIPGALWDSMFNPRSLLLSLLLPLITVATISCSDSAYDGSNASTKADELGCAGCQQAFSTCIADVRARNLSEDDQVIAETGCFMDFNDCGFDLEQECTVPDLACQDCQGTFADCIANVRASDLNADDQVTAETGCFMDFNDCTFDLENECEIAAATCSDCQSVFTDCIANVRASDLSADDQVTAETGCFMDFNDCEFELEDECALPDLACLDCRQTFASCVEDVRASDLSEEDQITAETGCFMDFSDCGFELEDECTLEPAV